ncbi:MAG: hypothetical protein QXR48_02625 [Candidatus Woesearchaeota archaeon]
MTLFYYPASIETALALAEKGVILCPWMYELRRLRRLQQSQDPDEKNRFDTYVETYLHPNDTLSDLAMRVASIRHPVDIRIRTDKMPSEEEWLKSVRLYGNYNVALQHLQNPPVGVILGLELGMPPQELLLMPELVGIENRLKHVHIRADNLKTHLVFKAFAHYKPEFYKVKENP